MSEQPQRDSSPNLVEGAEQPDDGATPLSAAGRLIARFAGRTAVGQVREHNEDNFVIANLTTGQIRPRDVACEDEIGERGMLFSVCDGMGGAAAGEVASQMAVDILVEAMRRGGAPKNRDALGRRLVQAVEEAGRRIFQAAQKERSRRGMGTTTTAAVLIDKVLFLGEVGDSRGYLLRNGQLKQITKDQSLVNQLIEAGHLTEDEAEAFEHSNIILQALGTAESVNVDLTFVELRKGDRLMLCSDGLSGLVHFDTLRSALDEVKDPFDCCGKLIELAEAGGGHDNITCIVVDFDGDQLASSEPTDSFGYMQYPLPLSDEDSSAFVDEDTAGGPVREPSDDTSAAPTQRPLATQPALRAELEGEGDARASALWILAGALALVGAFGVWWTLDPKAQGGRAPDVAQPSVPLAPEPPPPDPAPAQDVQVNVYTDVQGATLLVNGESQGDLSTATSKSLRLRPGAYRFEAQAGGNPGAVSVVTVRGDVPMDVFLKAPTAGETPAPEEQAVPKDDKPEGEPEGARGAEPESAVAETSEEPTREPAAARAARAARRASAAAAAAPSTPAPSAAPGGTGSNALPPAPPALPEAIDSAPATPPAARKPRPSTTPSGSTPPAPAPPTPPAQGELPSNPF
jgi:serine/threonine protein phosphatase PrpC